MSFVLSLRDPEPWDVFIYGTDNDFRNLKGIETCHHESHINDNGQRSQGQSIQYTGRFYDRKYVLLHIVQTWVSSRRAQIQELISPFNSANS